MFGKIKQTLTGLSQRPNLMAALRNLGWLAFDRVFRLGVSFVVTLWLARYLAPELFGVYNYAIAFTALFSVVATFGLQSVVVQYLVDKPDQQASTLASAFLIQFVGGLFAFVLAVVVALILTSGDSAVLMAVVLLSSINLFKFSDTVRYYFESRVQSKRIVIIENLVFMLIVLLRIAMILLELTLIYFVALLVLEAVLTTLAFFWLFGIRKLKALKFDKSNFLSVLNVAWLLALSVGAAMLYMRVDQIMLASLLNQEAVGIYSAAVRISEIWYVFPAVIVGSVFPRIIRELRIDAARANRQLDVLFTTFSIVSILVGLLVGGYSTEIILFLFGEEYRASASVLSIHVWSSVFVFSGILGGRWLVAMDMQKVLLLSTLIGVVSNIVMNYLMIPVYGVEGAAWSTLVAQFISAILVNCVHPVSRQLFWMQVSALSLLSVRNLVRWWRLNSR
ncbi:flippase [uncultured Limnobacter sp.]|uniref:flippase n=1 Tax=uncultured Limnobacter sp. TaxID=199681 RepID=UPI0030FD1377